MKLAIVTGCAKGIGREISLNLAKKGYNIIGTYNTSLDEVSELEKNINFIGTNFYSYKLDLKEEKQIEEFSNYIVKNHKNIDVLVNNAALSLDQEFELKTKDEFVRVLEVNLIAPFLLIQKLKNKLYGGNVINISSTDGINTYSKLNIDYSASKAGLINLTKSLALCLDNIKIYAICPNWVNTESIKEMDQDYLKSELKRVGQKKLIEPIAVATKVIELLEGNYESGSVIIMEDCYEK